MGLEEIRARIDAAAERAGRRGEAVELVAVSKKQPDARVEAVLEAGHRIFGENRVQEAEGKWPAFRERFGEVRLHLIGPLQTNKARQAMELFDVIQVLDRDKLATTLARLAQETGSCPDLYVQVNTGEEAQKSGILPEEADAFVARCRSMDLPVRGLMCIPPIDEEPALHFALLARIAERTGLDGLSMGMSADFETAVSLGATCVRVGSAIFGERPSD